MNGPGSGMKDGAGNRGRPEGSALSGRPELAAARGVITGALLGALVWVVLLLAGL